MEEEEDEVPFTSTTVQGYVDELEKQFENIPDKRKKKEYIIWKDKVNDLIEKCNKLSGIKMYAN